MARVGGIVTTNDEQLAILMKSLMFHGRDNIYLKIEDDNTSNKLRLNSLIERRFQFEHIGYSFRLTEMEGALGLAELENKDEIIKKRQLVGRNLTKSLSKFSKFFKLPKVRPESEHIYMLFPIVICDDRIDKEDFLLFLEEHSIETRLFMPLLSQPVYKKIFGEAIYKFPAAKMLENRGFIIGSHPYLTGDDIKYVQSLFELYLKNTKLLEK